MPLERRHARLLAAIALVAVAAFAVLWIAARTPMARTTVAGWIADAAGLPARIESLRIGFLPSPSLDIGGLAIEQPPGFGDDPIVSAGRLELRIPWRGVFGLSRIEAIAASDVTLRLAVGTDGAANWSQLGGAAAAGGPPRQEPATAWSIGALALESGTIDYRDAATGGQWQLTAIALEATDVAPGAPFPVGMSLGGVSGANTLHYAMQGQARFDFEDGQYEARSLEFRGWLGGEPLPLAGAEFAGSLARASYDDAAGVAQFEGGRILAAGIPGTFHGRFELGEPEATAQVHVETEAFAPRASAIILGHPLPATADPDAFSTFQVALDAQLEEGRLRLDPISGRLDDTSFDGSAVPELRRLRAHLDRIDVNRYLPRAAKSAGTQKATLEAAIAPLAELDLDAEIRIDEALVGGARIRDALIRIEREEGAAP